jgi:hypothetical protein
MLSTLHEPVCRLPTPYAVWFGDLPRRRIRDMFRRTLSFGLIALILFQVPAAADTREGPPAPRTSARSSTKRVVWTLVGIGAGFGAGVLLGLNAFDDAINSDRKVWLSAIAGAAAGGLAAGLLSKNVGREPSARGKSWSGAPADLRRASPSVVLPATSPEHALLRRRVRDVSR